MSADNWTQCPQCLARAEAAHADLQRRASEAYGVLPLAEFDALRAEAEKPVAVNERWREDYEIYGAESGTVHVSYTGSCTVCKLSIKFSDEHPIVGFVRG